MRGKFGKVAVLIGGSVGGRSRGPACRDATPEALVAAQETALIGVD